MRGGESSSGKTHDITAFRETGLAEFLDHVLIEELVS
jgi:hypothetical protein